MKVIHVNTCVRKNNTLLFISIMFH